MDAEQAPELLERALVVIHSQVNEDVGESRIALLGSDNEDRCRLLPAPVSARSLCGVEAVEQALDEGLARRRLEGIGERVDRLSRDEDVPLRCVAGSGAAPRPLVALVAGERGSSPARVDDAELPLCPVVVCCGQLLDRLLR